MDEHLEGPATKRRKIDHSPDVADTDHDEVTDLPQPGVEFVVATDGETRSRDVRVAQELLSRLEGAQNSREAVGVVGDALQGTSVLSSQVLAR